MPNVSLDYDANTVIINTPVRSALLGFTLIETMIVLAISSRIGRGCALTLGQFWPTILLFPLRFVPKDGS